MWGPGVAGTGDSAREQSRAESVERPPPRTTSSRSGNRTAREPYLKWCGALVCLVMVIAALGGIATSEGWFQVGRALPAPGTDQAGVYSQLPGLVSCAEFGASELRSPAEGVWFESNCVAEPVAPLAASVTNCNRTSLDAADFTLVAPGLFVTGGASAPARYLWYASSDNCFDLVSTRAVTAVCADETVTFSWTSSPCATHGGVLAWVNGR